MDILIMALAITGCMLCLMIDRPFSKLSIYFQLECHTLKIKLYELKFKRQHAEYTEKLKNAKTSIEKEVYQANITTLNKTLKEIKLLLEE